MDEQNDGSQAAAEEDVIHFTQIVDTDTRRAVRRV